MVPHPRKQRELPHQSCFASSQEGVQRPPLSRPLSPPSHDSFATMMKKMLQKQAPSRRIPHPLIWLRNGDACSQQAHSAVARRPREVTSQSKATNWPYQTQEQQLVQAKGELPLQWRPLQSCRTKRRSQPYARRAGRRMQVECCHRRRRQTMMKMTV